MALASLPGPVQELWSVWREIEGKAAQPITLGLVASSGPDREHWRDALLIGSHDPDKLKLIEAEAQTVPSADLYLVIVTSNSGIITRELPVLERLDRSKLMVALVGMPEHLAATRQRELVHALDLAPDQVVPVSSLKDLAGPFARALFERHGDMIIPLSRQFPIFRSEAAWQEVQATSKQNAVIGALPLPGADMPIMTANQIKMLMRIAAMFDLPLNVDRAKELLAVVGGGFALRTVSRQFVKVVPWAGWAIAGGIGYTGTIAMGKAAIEYFKRNAPSHQVSLQHSHEVEEAEGPVQGV
ncbi:MAG TPA: DUF697 domain-containing protein [Stenomitos sp.]